MNNINYNEIPAGWAFCQNGECPKAKECLRYLACTSAPILSDKQYDDGWFYQKKKVIIKSFEVYGGPPYDVHQLYPEIHARLLKELGNAGFLSQRGGIVLCLKGHKRLGYFLFRFVVWFKNMVRQLTNNKISFE